MTRLLLVPTAMERDCLLKHVQEHATETGMEIPFGVELCGFGVIAAAARTAQLIEQCHPSHVILAGIAGSVGSSLSIGSAHWFDEVVCHGIGVGSGVEHQSAQSIGWPHFVSDRGESIGDRLCLINPTKRNSRLALRTVCAASSHANEYPVADANAEDMEGFAVALACLMADVPCSILRGMSNRVGDRNHKSWDIDGALSAVAKVILNELF